MDSDSSEGAVDILHGDLEQEQNGTSSNPATIQNNHGQESGDVAADQDHYPCEAPVPSTSSPVRPIGGSVSTDTSHASRHASGNQALELVEAIIRRSEPISYDTTVETRGESGHDVCEVNVHVTQTNIHNPAAIALGGQVVVNPPKKEDETSGTPHPPTGIQKLRSETERTFERWTEGMVKTVATQTVLEKIIKGRTWITITGSPGEGKTTAGYLVLKHLHNMGRQVYNIKTPEDYHKTKEIKAPVLMFNDIFGHLHFDIDKVKRWEVVLSEILEMKEHRQEKEMDAGERRKHGPTAILISRSSVLNAASHYLGRFKDLVFKGDCVIDFTNGLDMGTEDRLKVWQSHSEKYDVQINKNIIKEVCKMSLPHGFPHCCRLFAAMYAKNKHLDMKLFFSKPLEFLNQTMESFMMNDVTGPLLREMLRRDGSLDLDSIADDERRFQYRSVVHTLSGTYLSQDNCRVTFHHPSVYDSAAFVVCTTDPLFVIQNCSMQFLNERVRFEGHETERRNETQHTVTIDSRYISVFLDRLKTEFADENLSHTLSHEAFHDEGFVSQFMQCVLRMAKRRISVSYLIGKARSVFSKTQQMSNSVRHLINMRDRTSRKSFLFLLTKSKSDKVLRYICQYVELSQDEQTQVLFGICEHTSVASLEFFIGTFRDFNLDGRLSELDTPLLVASGKTSEKILKILLERDVDVCTTDNKGNSALHKICRYGVEGDGDVVKTLIDKGADVNETCPGYPNFPLHIACYRVTEIL